ncbi:MAG: hypothetical protein JWR24_2337 [Actinoallomurus sp.]|nr:hypothetical protein [Actinoallomurus sp.]
MPTTQAGDCPYRTPSAWNTASKPAVNLVSLSRITNASWSTPSPRPRTGCGPCACGKLHPYRSSRSASGPQVLTDRSAPTFPDRVHPRHANLGDHDLDLYKRILPGRIAKSEFSSPTRSVPESGLWSPTDTSAQASTSLPLIADGTSPNRRSRMEEAHSAKPARHRTAPTSTLRRPGPSHVLSPPINSQPKRAPRAARTSRCTRPESDRAKHRSKHPS